MSLRLWKYLQSVDMQLHELFTQNPKNLTTTEK